MITLTLINLKKTEHLHFHDNTLQGKFCVIGLKDPEELVNGPCSEFILLITTPAINFIWLLPCLCKQFQLRLVPHTRRNPATLGNVLVEESRSESLC